MILKHWCKGWWIHATYTSHSFVFQIYIFLQVNPHLKSCSFWYHYCVVNTSWPHVTYMHHDRQLPFPSWLTYFSNISRGRLMKWHQAQISEGRCYYSTAKYLRSKMLCLLCIDFLWFCGVLNHPVTLKFGRFLGSSTSKIIHLSDFRVICQISEWLDISKHKPHSLKTLNKMSYQILRQPLFAHS